MNQIEKGWDELRNRCCADPTEAKRCVMVSRDDFAAAIAAMQPAPQEAVMQSERRWQLGDKVKKKRGSSWRGTVCGFYSTPHTPEGYCVDSAFEPGSVQVWPEAALEDWDGGSDAE